MKAELITGLPFPDYQRIDALNMTLLKELDDSPGRLDWRRRNPWVPTDPAILGNAIHTLCLEPSEYARRYLAPPRRFDELPDFFVEVPPEFIGAAGQLLKAGKDWVAALDEGTVPVKPGDWNGDGLSTRSDAGKAWKKWTESQGLTVLTRSTTQQAHSAASEVLGYEPARELLDAGSHEVTLVWQDPLTSLWCKGRMDCYDAGARTETDLKTTSKSVHHERIGSPAYLAGWHIQRAFYGMGMEAIGQPLEVQNVIAVEVDEPWRCEVYSMGEAELEMGRAKIQGWTDSDGQKHLGLLEKYAGWARVNEWPMNTGRILPMRFPGWTFKERDR